MKARSNTAFAKRLRYSTAVLALVAMGIPAAHAQDEAQTAQVDLEQIVVTGTRIVRDGFEAPTPVSVLSTEQLNAMGTINIIDAVNRMPVLLGTITTKNSSAADMTGGIQNLNLRGLTPQRTLVLLDGKRLVGSTLQGFDQNNSAVDVNVLPNGLISRVDVVTGGASAVYGSDALAGVVNFVIDKEFTGVKGEAIGGITTYGDGEQYKVSLTAGLPFANGRGHFLVSGEHSYDHGIGTRPTPHAGRITLHGRAERPWYQSNSNLIPNPAYTAGGGAPQYISVDNVGLTLATRGGLITKGPLRGTQFEAEGRPVPFIFGPVSGGLLMSGGDWQSSRIDLDPMMQTRLLRANAFIRASYDVTENATVFAEYLWAHTHATSISGVPTFNLANISVKVDNAFLPASLKAVMDAAGETSFVLGTNNIDAPPFGARNTRHLRRYLIGAEGNFDAMDANWTWDAYYERSTTHASVRIPGDQIKANYQEAADSVLDPATGRIVCRSTLTNPGNGCVPYNVMGIGVNTQEAINYTTGTGYGLILLSQDVVAATAAGEPFTTWAGPVSVAFGVEHRKESIGGFSSALDQARAYFAGNFTQSKGSFNVTEGFIETVVPLAKDQDWARALDLNAAVRATSYSTAGYVTTWKVGATYSPIDDFTLRATQSRDIRAPTLGDLFSSGRSGTGNVFDPTRGGAPATIVTRIQGNKLLKSERANSTGVGIVLQPSALPGFGASVDFFNVKIKGAITSLAAQQYVDRCFAGETALCSAIERTDGIITFVAVQPANVLFQKLRGFDFEASYNFPLSDLVSSWEGDLSLRGMASYIMKLETADDKFSVDGAGVNADSGGGLSIGSTVFTPSFRYIINATYTNDPFRATLTARGIGSGVYNNDAIECTSTCPASIPAGKVTIDNNDISSILYFDLALNYQILDGGAEVFFVTDNLLNKGPPRIAGRADSGFYNGNGWLDFYDAIGRTFRAGVRFTM